MDIIKLAEKLGATDEYIAFRTKEYQQRIHCSFTEAEQQVCERFVIDTIADMHKTINTLKKSYIK